MSACLMVSDLATAEATAVLGIFRAFFMLIAAESAAEGGHGANLVVRTLNTRHSE